MKTVVYPLLLIGALTVYSQQYVDTYNPRDQEVKSLLTDENELNAFGALDVKIGNVLNERALLIGAYGGLIINRRYLFGLAGNGLVTNVTLNGRIATQNDALKQLNLYGGYGGLLIGATVAPRELIHLSFPIVVGAGSLDVVDKDFFDNNPTDSEFTIESSAFFVVEPAVQMEFNITKYFRLAAGASYRLVSGTKLENVADQDVSGATATISFRFGRF